MPRDTFRGDPVETTSGWVVIARYQDGRAWFPLSHTYSRTRRRAIERYNETWVEPGQYKRERRRGDVLAVHCVMQPVTFERET